jgi:hypothetical protein
MSFLLLNKNLFDMKKLKTILYVTFALMLITQISLVKAQDFVWARQAGGISNDVGYGIAVDNSGNVHTIGYFQGTVDFDPGPATFNLTSFGQYDIFIKKLDASGNLIWAKQLGGTGYDLGLSIAIDNLGNVYTTGYFSNTVDFDPGAGTFNLTSTGGIDVFISKLDSSGNFIWAKHIEGTENKMGYSLAIDNSGNVYTAGYFQGTVIVDPSIGNVNLTSAGGADIFICKFNSSGNFEWVKQIGGTDNDFGFSLALDVSGNIYTAGVFEGTVDFDPSVGTNNLTSSGGRDAFISKLDVSGNLIWAKNFGGINDEQARSIAIDASGNVYITGHFEGTADFDPSVGTFSLTSAGDQDIFINKLDVSGNFVWAKRMGGANNDSGRSLAIDGSGNIYTTGYFRGTTDFDPGSGAFNLTSAGGADIFIHKLDASGNFVWAKQIGSSSDEETLSIAIDGSGNIYTTGYFQGTLDFDPGAGTFNLNSAGGWDFFVHKMSQSTLSIYEYNTINTNIYPNPANDYLQIDTENNLGVEIYSLEGKLMDGKQINTNTRIDISQYNNGIYLIKLINENGMMSHHKFIKQ